MSKLITNTIRHTGGSADNITLDNSQNVTVEAKLTVANKDDANVNVLEVKNDNGNVSGGFTQASDGDGQIFSKKNDGTNTVLFRSDGDSYLLGGDLGIGESAPEELLHITHASAPAIQLESTSGGPYKSLIKMGGNDMEIRGSSGQIQFFQGNADGDSSSEKLRISSHGGIAFNGDTAAANCLNDYEEGTFTPKLGGNANNSTYNVSGTGAYTKIGNVVHMTIRFHGQDLDNNADGCAIIYDLPFTGSYGNANNSVAGVTSDHITYNIVFSDDQRYTWYVSHNTTYWQGRIVRSNNSWADWDIDDFNAQNVLYIDFSGTYRTT